MPKFLGKVEHSNPSAPIVDYSKVDGAPTALAPEIKSVSTDLGASPADSDRVAVMDDSDSDKTKYITFDRLKTWVRGLIRWGDVSGKPTFGSAATKDTGTASGEIPVLGSDGRLTASQVPAQGAAVPQISGISTDLGASPADSDRVAVMDDSDSDKTKYITFDRLKTWVRGLIRWSDVSGKPTTFPPSAHTQAVNQGGTGATSASVARTNLGVGSIGTKSIWQGSQSDYDRITTKENNTIYFII